MSSEKPTRAERLKSTIDDMLNLDETISTRNIMKRMPADFTYPSAITRPLKFRELYETGRQQQKQIRAAANRYHGSRAALEARIVKKDRTIAEQDTQIQILVASHRAMYAAIGELGGTKAWLRFFEKREAVLAMLDALQARPTVVSLIRTSNEIERETSDDAPHKVSH